MFIHNPENKDMCLIFCHPPKHKILIFLFVLGLAPICIILGKMCRMMNFLYISKKFLVMWANSYWYCRKISRNANYLVHILSNDSNRSNLVN
jgi:hypothetical protein